MQRVKERNWAVGRDSWGTLRVGVTPEEVEPSQSGSGGMSGRVSQTAHF